MVGGGVSQEVTFKLRQKGEEEASRVKSKSKGSPGRRNSMHKGPGAGKDFGNVAEIKRTVWLRHAAPIGRESRQDYSMHFE